MILLTGGAGFIGSNLLAALEAAGAGPVVVCDRLGSGDKWRNIAKREIADLVPPERLLDYLDHNGAGIDFVFHLGANSSTVEPDADLMAHTNFGLSLALWTWCARRGVRFIYASSAATYGDGGAGFDDIFSIEALARLRPLNPYGWSKHLFDRRVARMVAASEPRPPQWAGLKFFNVYGPNEYHKEGQRSVVPQIHATAATSGKARLFRSYDKRYRHGEQKRDFVWVDDAVSVMLWLRANPSVNGLFNVGTGKARSFADVARAVFAGLGRKPKIEFIDMPPALRGKYQYFTEARTDHLRQAGYAKPFTSVEQGVRLYVEKYLAADDPYR